MNKIKEFILKHPVDWKWGLIIYLAREKITRFMTYGVSLLSGIMYYPNEPPQSMFYNISKSMTDSLVKPMESMFSVGYNFGELLHPHNSWVANLISYLILALSIFLTIAIIYVLINLILTVIFKAIDKKNK